MKILLKVLLALLPLSSLADETCRASAFALDGKSLCFSSTHKTYLSPECAKGSCLALSIAAKKAQADVGHDSSSKHKGAKICKALGGISAVAVNTQTKDQLCICLATDASMISCDFLSRK